MGSTMYAFQSPDWSYTTTVGRDVVLSFLRCGNDFNTMKDNRQSGTCQSNY